MMHRKTQEITIIEGIIDIKEIKLTEEDFPERFQPGGFAPQKHGVSNL